jgi:hypothetical protein
MKTIKKKPGLSAGKFWDELAYAVNDLNEAADLYCRVSIEEVEKSVRRAERHFARARKIILKIKDDKCCTGIIYTETRGRNF